MTKKRKISNPKRQHQENDVNIDYSNVFTFGQIIKMPVEAIIGASIDASKSTYQFIKRFGFEKSKDKENPNKLGPPKMLTFTYRYNNAGVEQKMLVHIPVLSIITLPYLNIKKARFDVGIEILNHIQKKVQPTVDGIPVSEEDDTNVFVLLGPVEKKGIGGGLKEATEVYSESRIATNMQASIEVETTDLPAGVLQMLNLLQDASSGKGRDIYKLHCGPSDILFDATNSEISLQVEIRKNGKGMENELIEAKVVSDTDPNLFDSFENEIEVTQGNIVGITTVVEGKALSNKNGRVSFKFSALKNVKSQQNGFIYFNTVKASKIAVYYKIK